MNDDFGFSLVTEKELRAQEEVLTQRLEETMRNSVAAQEALNQKIRDMRDMIMPLLQNLAKDPDKDFIRWPNRAAKVQEFIDKINSHVNN